MNLRYLILRIRSSDGDREEIISGVRCQSLAMNVISSIGINMADK